ncbi:MULTISPECIES: RNA polymerase sigma factor [Paenibacillus]|jgi:RNA polymerase sigma factor (sigma-70 family)|uniref:Sigma-70 family RNA polymerase sigma factor n=1 Tax=Paenibacillus baimaensis TaxID=2982185 RepID=A0ABT2U7T9_9BACL|nr:MULTISPECIES: sigma-70 family RNA polymerase sigma factor [unclassified Paenibacillus]MCU6790693.1 sigma-70 family RNA polymerase sigma factor [Paenibacillus sp. WQ 127069]OMF05007.1 RNA polymerase subunit sigma-24 [Paenibacillus sp. FSL H7-0331]
MNGLMPDQELMKRISAKDEEALKQLYDHYEKPIYSFAYRMVRDAMMSEEIVQELFLRIWQTAERFDGAQGKLTSWMFTLTRNITIDLLRKKRSRTPHSMAEPDQLQFVADERMNTELNVEKKWVGEQVKAALDDLNEDQKKVVEWIYYQGYTHQEVSDMYAIPLGTVKSRVRLAMKQLQRRLSDGGRREFSNE